MRLPPAGETVVVGLLAGVVGALVVTRLIGSLLYGIGPSPATLGGVVALLLGAENKKRLATCPATRLSFRDRMRRQSSRSGFFAS